MLMKTNFHTGFVFFYMKNIVSTTFCVYLSLKSKLGGSVLDAQQLGNNDQLINQSSISPLIPLFPPTRGQDRYAEFQSEAVRRAMLT